jgi:predicted nucleic acid-binding protein
MGTTVANLAEFANTATRPTSANGLGLSPAQAQLRIRNFERQLAIFSESIESYEIWKRLVAEHEVCGKQVHDTRIVAIMLQEGIRSILTFNTADFIRFPEIITLHPGDVLGSA